MLHISSFGTIIFPVLDIDKSICTRHMNKFSFIESWYSTRLVLRIGQLFSPPPLFISIKCEVRLACLWLSIVILMAISLQSILSNGKRQDYQLNSSFLFRYIIHFIFVYRFHAIMLYKTAYLRLITNSLYWQIKDI